MSRKFGAFLALSLFLSAFQVSQAAIAVHQEFGGFGRTFDSFIEFCNPADFSFTPTSTFAFDSLAVAHGHTNVNGYVALEIDEGTSTVATSSPNSVIASEFATTTFYFASSTPPTLIAGHTYTLGKILGVEPPGQNWYVDNPILIATARNPIISHSTTARFMNQWLSCRGSPERD